MQEKSTTRQLVESALLTAITVILVLIRYYIPLLSFVGFFITPIPIILIYLRNGVKNSLISLIIVFVLVAITINPVGSLVNVICLAITGLSLAYCIKNKKSSVACILAAGLGVFFTLTIILKLSALLFGQDITALLFEELSKAPERVANMYRTIGIPGEQIDTLLKSIPTVEDLKLLMPFGMISSSMILGLFIYSITAIILRKFGYNLEKVRPFSSWYLPMELMITMLAIIIIAFIINGSGISDGEIYIINIMQIFNLIVGVNGLALVAFSLKKKGVNKLLSFLIFYFLVSSPLSRFLYFIGLIDYVLDYRKLDPKRKRYKLQ